MKPYPSMPGESQEECVARMKTAGTYYEHHVEYATTHERYAIGFATPPPKVPEGSGWEMLSSAATASANQLSFVELFWFWKRVRRLSQAELGL